MAIQNISDFHREKVTVTAFAKIIKFRRSWLWIRGKSDVRSDVQSKTLIESIIKIWVYKKAYVREIVKIFKRLRTGVHSGVRSENRK